MTSSGCSNGGGPSQKGKGTNRTGGSTILKLIWEGIYLYFPGFGDLQPYETWKFRICCESVSRVFSDLFRISLRKCLTVLGAPPNICRLQQSAMFPRSFFVRHQEDIRLLREMGGLGNFRGGLGLRLFARTGLRPIKSAFAKRGACKRGVRKLGIGHHQLHSNYILETWSNHDCR